MIKIAKALLSKIDSTIVNLAGWRHIPYSNTNFMYLSPHKYKGKSFRLDDDTVITKGDWVAELHIDNKKIKVLDTSYRNLLNLLKGEIEALGKALKEEPYCKIKSVYGITVFYDIARRQGFTIKHIDNKLIRFFGSIWENILRVVLKNKTSKINKNKNVFIAPKECWLSKVKAIHFSEKR